MIQIQQSKALSNLSLTPLIDVVFLLVIFFLVSTRFSEEERSVDINVPDSLTSVPMSEKPQELVVNITAEGKFLINEKEYNDTELYQTLKQHWNNNPPKNNVIIRADRNCRFEPIFFCIDSCREIGIKDYCVTVKEKGIE